MKVIIWNRKETALNNIMMIIEDLQSILKTIQNSKDTHLKTMVKNGGMKKTEDMMIIKIIIIKIIIKNTQNGKKMVRKYNHKAI